MRKFAVFALVVLFIAGCGSRSTIPLNKGFYSQRNVFSVDDILGLSKEQGESKIFDGVRFEFGSNDQNKTIKKQGVRVQKYVMMSPGESMAIKDACAEAFRAIVVKYINVGTKHKADIVNISSSWRGEVEALKDEVVCMSSISGIGIMMSADLAQK